MLSRREAIWRSFTDPEYRRAWAGEHGVGLAFQIRALRAARGWTQTDLANKTGISRATISRWEDPGYGRYTLSTLDGLAAAFDVGLMVRFAPFSDLIDWNVNLSAETLAPPEFRGALRGGV